MKSWQGERRWRLVSVVVLSLILGVTLLSSPGCAIGYLATQGYFQGRLLLGRVTVEEALNRADVTPAIKRRLELVQAIRRFGEERLHMTPTQNYTTINLSWNQEIWNVSACRELEFAPYTWWFPIVGTVPYKGFFRKSDGEQEERRLRAAGYDTALRRVAGYSTLGWFRDPILPQMLFNPDGDLANLVLHELAHATLFIPDRVDFNESFASFVGREASLRFLEAQAGPDSAAYRDAKARYADEDRFTAFMHDLYLELEQVYSTRQSDEKKRRRKAEVLEAAGRRYRALPFETERYRGYRVERMNNADLMQFRRYSGAATGFATVLAGMNGDMARFFETFRAIAHTNVDPLVALATMTGEKKSGER